MKRAAIWTLVSVAAIVPLAPRAGAQPVFFDDFSGPTLDPRWRFDLPPFDYTLAGGRLTVTRLNGRFPEPPPHGPDYTYGAFGVDLPRLNDFRVTVDLGWAPGTGRRLTLLPSPGGGSMYLSELTGLVGLFFYGGGFVGSLPTPPPGPHRFTIIRQAGRFRWLLDDVEIAQAPDQFGSPVTQLYLMFDGPWSGLPAPMWLDSVLVVPAPSFGALAPAAVALCLHRRRR